MQTAKGTFNVNLKPVGFYKDQTGCDRMTLQKTFEGQLAGLSYGEMLSSMGLGHGNAGYVAIERFTGSINDKQGSFSLMHYGRMNNKIESLILEVVPGTGTKDFANIQGSMSIDIDNHGVHTYTFEYSI